jgi:hypothetical protein
MVLDQKASEPLEPLEVFQESLAIFSPSGTDNTDVAAATNPSRIAPQTLI